MFFISMARDENGWLGTPRDDEGCLHTARDHYEDH